MQPESIPIKRHGLAHVETYDVTADELDRMERAAGDTGLDFQIAQFALTVASSFLAAVLTTKVKTIPI